MPDVNNQNCPLCDNPADFEYRDHKNRKHFYCGTCVEFQISRIAEKRLASSVVGWRSIYSGKAKKSDGVSVLVILSSNVKNPKVMAKEVLHGEYVHRSALPK